MRRAAAIVLAAALLLTGCTSTPTEPQDAARQSSGSPSSDAPSTTPPITVLATGLQAPWSILRLGAEDSTLISERDRGVIRELTPTGKLRAAGTVAGVVHEGESGLLGLESLVTGGTHWIYAYLTTASDNRIVRMALRGSSGSYRLGSQRPILTGLAKAFNHDGGRIKFGPDGMLYATVGDAGVSSRAQDPQSRNGKILRMTPTGAVPADNPTRGSLVYSLGHRNPQGLAWDASGQLWASEFGQDTWDEFNRIVPGANYGWPFVEGRGNRKGFVDPVFQWRTAEASPSGLAEVDGTFYLAALRGERLFTMRPNGSPTAILVGQFGRLRDVAQGPAGTIWLLTNNTDGRGSPRSGDDQLLQLTIGDGGPG